MARVKLVKEVVAATPTDFWFGPERERTPAHGMQTLFVRGIQMHGPTIEQVKRKDIRHIHLGIDYVGNRTKEWHALALCFLENEKREYWVTLEVPQEFVYEVAEYGSALKHKRFIPILVLPLPELSKIKDSIYLRADDYESASSWTTDGSRAFRSIDLRSAP